MKALLFAAAAVAATCAAPASAAEISQAGPGCLDRGYAEKMFTLRDVDQDLAAFGTMIDVGLRDGNCRIFKIGMPVDIESRGLFALSCVRPEGEVACFWVLPTMAE